jgi:acyl-homoserine-lactone acylase
MTMSGRSAPPRMGRLLRAVAALPLVALLGLAGCSDSSDGGDDKPTAPPAKDYLNAPAAGPVAVIRRTTNGVPHVKADNLESAAFGVGYAQAQDNVCVLADAFVKARSERARYFGPGPGNIHVINDFSYKAQRILSGAAAEYATLSAESKALIKGFVGGYNKYVRETPKASLPAECRNAPWVFEITVNDLVAHMRILVGYASGDRFATGALFLAVPPGVDPNPAPATVATAKGLDALGKTAQFARASAEWKQSADVGLASNAWGIGGDLSENGKGVLLANPHFPYTGARRLYEMQVTVPDYVNFHGAGLYGSPFPQLGFNENLGWSHTVSRGNKFTIYELKLKAGDNLTYVKDGVEKPITSEMLSIQVATGGPTPVTLQRRFYFSEYGPIFAADAFTGGLMPAWGAAGTAYTYRDANPDMRNWVDTWLKMARATNLEQFKDVFRDCGTTLWVNTTYADDQGNAYYIDSSSVPNLSPMAMLTVKGKVAASAVYRTLYLNGLVLLEATSRDDWVEGTCRGLVPFEERPQLVRRDFVQNSNDSHWATNPAVPLEGFSPLFGPERTEQGPRTRIGLYMLQNPEAVGYGAEKPAGQDGKFSAADVAKVLHNNRTWYAEEFLGELRSRCTLVGAGLVNVPGGTPRSVQSACNVLKAWNGRYDVDSVGAHVFRVFIADYRSKFATHLTAPFNPAHPVFTPSTPAPVVPTNLANDPMLVSLASGLNRLDQAGIAYNAAFGTVQVLQPSGGAAPGGTAVALGSSFPWHGGDGTIDGAFNAVTTVSSDVWTDTRIPRINPPTIANTAGLSSTPGLGWQIGYGTSWHFGLEFTANGPKALGLVSYSQSTNSASPYFSDQMRRYSEKNMRAIPFSEEEIAAALVSGGETTVRLN